MKVIYPKDATISVGEDSTPVPLLWRCYLVGRSMFSTVFSECMVFESREFRNGVREVCFGNGEDRKWAYCIELSTTPLAYDRIHFSSEVSLVVGERLDGIADLDVYTAVKVVSGTQDDVNALEVDL